MSRRSCTCCFQHDGNHFGCCVSEHPVQLLLVLFSVYFSLDTAAFDFLLSMKGYSQFLCSHSLPSQVCSFQEAILSKTLEKTALPVQQTHLHPSEGILQHAPQANFYICCMPYTMHHQPSPQLLCPRRRNEGGQLPNLLFGSMRLSATEEWSSFGQTQPVFPDSSGSCGSATRQKGAAICSQQDTALLLLKG